MTAHPDAVKAAASALSVHLGDPGDWYDIAAVAVAAAAPVLLAPVQAEVERLRDACRQGVHFVDDLRRVQRKLAAERDEARAEVERLRVEVQNVWRFAVNEVRIKRDLIARGKQTADVALADLGALFARIAEGDA